MNETGSPVGRTATEPRGRRWGWVALDLALAAAHGALAHVVAANEGTFAAVSLVAAAAYVVAAVGTTARMRWGRWVGLVACGALLALGVGLIVVLVLAAAFLRGVHGAFGTAAAAGSVVAAALVVQLYVLPAALQLRALARARPLGGPRARPEA